MKHEWVKTPGRDAWHMCKRCKCVLTEESRRETCPGWPEPPMKIVVGGTTYWRNDLVDIKPEHAEFIIKAWEL